jgi:hypothetical protein
MARRCYRELLRGKARDQTDDQLQERINELRALAEFAVDMFLSTPARPDIDGGDVPANPAADSSRDDVEDWADALASTGMSLREARRLAQLNQQLGRGIAHG